MTACKLPSSDSPNLALLHPTQQEKEETWKLNGSSWRGSMPLSIYLRREAHLENQAFTKDGGITFWILVDRTLSPDERPILGSCESLRKRALVAKDGKVAEVVSHGIGSVFCNPEYRRRGYAQRMMEELGKNLGTWKQEDGRRTDFTVLYSDIGKVCKILVSCVTGVAMILIRALDVLLKAGLETLSLKPYRTGSCHQRRPSGTHWSPTSTSQ